MRIVLACIALLSACNGTAENRAKACCACVAGAWSQFGDCTLLEDQLSSYQACALGTGSKDQTGTTSHHLRHPGSELSAWGLDARQTAEVCSELLVSEPDNEVLAVTDALLWLEAGETERAAQALSELASQSWHSARPGLAVELYVGLAQAQDGLGQHTAAEGSLRQPLLRWELASTNLAYLATLARLAEHYRAQGDDARADDCGALEAGLREQLPISAFRDGRVRLLAGDPQGALTALEPVTTFLASRPPDSCAQAGNQLFARLHTLHGFAALAAGDDERAELAFGCAEVLDSVDPGLAPGRGHLDLRRGRYAEAEAAFRRWSEEPRAATSPLEHVALYQRFCHDMAWIGLGWALTHQGRPAEALPCYDEVLERDPEAFLALLGRANALVATERYEEADEAVKRLLVMAPDHPEVLVQAGIVRYLRGDDGRAEDHFLQALASEATPRSCPFEGLGLVYLRQGEPSKAREHFEAAIELAPDAEYKKYNGMARILIDAGELDRAAEMLAASKRNQPDNPDADALLGELARARGAP